MKSILTICAALYSINSVAQFGVLDNTFNNNAGFNGFQYLNASTNPGVSPGQTFVIQSTGKIVVLQTYSSTNNIVTRFNNNGTIDSSFGFNGTFSFTTTTSADQPYNIVLLPYDKLVIQTCNYIYKITSNGVLDTSFSHTGYISAPYCNFCMSYSQIDSTLVIYDEITSPYTHCVISKLDLNGNLVMSFGTHGFDTVNYAGLTASGTLNIQTDGKILIQWFHSGAYSCVMRLNSNGTIDNTYGINGISDTLRAYVTSYGSVQTDGKYLLTGMANTANYLGLRLNLNGKIDSSFGTNGFFTTTYAGSAYSINIFQIDSSVLLIGGINPTEFNVTKLNMQGIPDASFGSGGTCSVPYTLFNPSIGATLAWSLPDTHNDIILVGHSSSGSSTPMETVILKIKNSLYTGVVPISNSPVELKVYPNPNKGEFTVNLWSDYNEQVSYCVTNILSEKVIEVTAPTNKSVHIKLDVANGIYILSGTTAHGKYVAKINVE